MLPQMRLNLPSATTTESGPSRRFCSAGGVDDNTCCFYRLRVKVYKPQGFTLPTFCLNVTMYETHSASDIFLYVHVLSTSTTMAITEIRDSTVTKFNFFFPSFR